MAGVIRGQVATYNRDPNIQREHWERKVTDILPNGHVPMTTFMDRAGSLTTTSRKYHWWDKEEPSLSGTVTDVYTDAAMSAAYSSGGVDGQSLYLKMAEADAAQILRGHTLSIYTKPSASNLEVATTTLVPVDVRDVAIDGANSRVSVRLMGDDSGNMLAEASLGWFIQADFQAEGDELPDSIFREPTPHENQTGIHMAACEMTGSELKEMERIDPDKWERAIKESMRDMRKRRERALIFSTLKTSFVNGKEKRHYNGLRAFIPSENFFNVRTNTAWAGKVWATGGGLDIVDDIVLNTSRIKTDSTAKQMFVGDLGFQAISRVVQNSTHFSWAADETVYGVRVKTLRGTMKDLHIVIHPMFNEIDRFRRSGLITELSYLKHVIFRPLQFITGKVGNDESGYDWVDAKKAGWFIEQTVKCTHAKAFGFVDNLGLDGPSA